MFSSIRTKLTLWYIGVLAVVIIAFAAAGYIFTIRILNRDLNERMEEMSRNFAVAYEAEQSDEDERPDADQAIRETIKELRFRDYQFAVYTAGGRLVAATMDESGPADANAEPGFEDISANNVPYRVYASPIDLRGIGYKLLVVHSLREPHEFQGRLLSALLIGVPLTLVLAGLGGYFLARKSLSPVAEMSRQAAEINAQNLDERLAVRNERDELGQLAIVFNDLLARLDASFEQQRRFMADASHELRTPLAIVRGESEVTLSKGDRPSDEYRSSLAIVHDESLRLTKIVEDLFTLARADAGQFHASFAPVYLEEIVADAVRSIRVLAREKDVSISYVSGGEMPLSGDESLLRRLFLNLLDNAVKYNRDGGSVVIESKIMDDDYVFYVTDNGSGIPPLEAAHIFDRFYRVDPSRSRVLETSTSGAGLGLAIVRWIAELHNANVRLASSGAGGSTFTVKFTRDSVGQQNV